MTAGPRDGRVLQTGDTASPEPVPVDADPDQDAGAPLPLWQAYGRQQARQRRRRIQPDGGRLISHADTPVPPPRPAAPIDPRLAPARQASADGDWARARSGWAALLAADPAQADHAYNLAVALDQRGERQEAIRHYRMALALADARPARFPRAPTLRRLATLEEE